MQSFNTIVSGEVQGGTTAAQMPDVPCALIKIKALSNNSGNVYLGADSSVSIAGTVTSTTMGYELDAGQETDWLPIDNLNKLWMITDANADDVCYIAFR
jgi:hypothetical protein